MATEAKCDTEVEGAFTEPNQPQIVWRSGYVKMTQSNADPRVYWAEFRSKSNQLHLFDREGSVNEPEEIIYLSTCNADESDPQKRYVMLHDECTGIRYKFEPHQDAPQPQGWWEKFTFFKNQCIIDLLCTDVSQMNARQQFNRFLLYQEKLARLQKQQLPKLVDAAKKATDSDKAFKEATTWLQRQKLDDDDRVTFGRVLSIRNAFWNLLLDTRSFINKDYVSVCKICSVFVRWTRISQKQDALNQRDKKILVWGLTELAKFTDSEKREEANALKREWHDLSHQIVECQQELVALQQKWKVKVEKAQKTATICNWIGGIAMAVGGIIAGVASVLALISTAPVWMPWAAGALIVGGAVVVGCGQANLNTAKNVQKKIDDTKHVLKHVLDQYRTHQQHIEEWVTSVELLEIPLFGIGGPDGPDGTDDFKPEIDTWQQIAEHEKGLLKRAATTFEKFRENALKSLNAIRDLQREIEK